MGKIIFEDIEIYSYHGHFPEEKTIGGKYLVNLEIDTAFEDAFTTDKLSDTVDYQLIFDIIQHEMVQKSSLLEHVAFRIVERLFKVSGLIWAIKIKLSKMNPPLGGKLKAVCIEINKERDK